MIESIHREYTSLAFWARQRQRKAAPSAEHASVELAHILHVIEREDGVSEFSTALLPVYDNLESVHAA